MNDSHDNGATGRVAAYLDARDAFPHLDDQIAEAKNGGSPWARLTTTDLRAVLAENETMRQQLARARNFRARIVAINFGLRGKAAHEEVDAAAEAYLDIAGRISDALVPPRRLVGEWQPAEGDDDVQR